MRIVSLLSLMMGCLIASQSHSVSAEEPRLDAVGDPLPSGAIARLGTTRLRHGGTVRDVAFSSDGRSIATASSDHSVCFWDAKTCRRMQRHTFEARFLRHVAFSPDGSHYVVVNGKGSVTLCTTKSGHREYSFGAVNRSGRARFSPDGQSVLTTGRHGVEVWNLNNVGPKLVLESPGALRDAMFTPDGAAIVAWEEKIIRRIDAKTGERVLAMTGHTNTIRSVDVSPDGKLVASASEDGTFRLWDATTGRQLHRQDKVHGGRDVSAIRFSPDGRLLATAGYDRSVRFWDVLTKKQVRSFDGVFQRQVRFSPDGKRVATFGGNGTTVRLLDAKTGKPSPPLPGHRSFARAMVFLNGGKLLATATSNDSSLRVWDYKSGRQVRVWQENLASQIATVPGTNWVAATGRNSFAMYNVVTGVRRPLAKNDREDVIRYWWPTVTTDGKRMVTVERSSYRVEGKGDHYSYRRGARLITWQLPEGRKLRSSDVEGITRSVLFLDDGKQVIGFTSKHVPKKDGGYTTTEQLKRWRIDEVGGEHVLCEWTRNASGWTGIQALTLSPDTSKVAIAHGYSGVQVVETESGKVLHDWTATRKQKFSHVNFTADGKRLLAGPGRYHIWEVASGKLARVVETPGEHGAISPDGRWLATGDREGVVTLWDLSSGEVLTRFEGHNFAVNKVLFSLDGKHLISSSRDCTLLVWSLDTRDWPPRPEASKR